MGDTIATDVHRQNGYDARKYSSPYIMVGAYGGIDEAVVEAAVAVHEDREVKYL